MRKLLPPQVVGPVYVSDISVDCSGARSGAAVTLLQDNVALGSAVAGDSGTAAITFAAGVLKQGASLAAKQEFEGKTSESSRYPEPVLNLPGDAPILAILSQAHPCMDALLVGGVVKGATVELLYQGSVIAFQGGYGTTVYIPIPVSAPQLKRGEVVEVRQRYTVDGITLVSPKVSSFMMQDLPLPEPLKDGFSLPAPVITGMPVECQTTVTVRGILPGAMLELSINGQQETFWYSGESLTVGVPRLKEGMKLSAVQRFDRCQLRSLPSAEVTVGKAIQPGQPRIEEPVCLGAGRVTLSNLDPGAQVVIGVRFTSAQGGYDMDYWEGTASARRQTFDLPRNLQDELGGPPQAIFALQHDCNDRASMESGDINFAPAGPASVKLGPLRKCMRRVRVETGQAGVVVELLSDRTARLASPTLSYGPYVDIDLYRGLFAFEQVTAVAEGCSGAPGAQDNREAEDVDQLNAPNVRDPVREWMTSLRVLDCMPGACVQVFVNEILRGSANAVTDECDVFVGDLHAGTDTVTARQKLCNLKSEFGWSIPVEMGQMNATNRGQPIHHGPAIQEVIVDAYDADFQHPVQGMVYDTVSQNPLGPTGSPMKATFPYSGDDPAWEVRAAHYNKSSVFWFAVYDEPVASFVAKPMKAPAPVLVHFTDKSTGAISSWLWDFGYQGRQASSQHSSFYYEQQAFNGYNVSLTVSGPGGSSTAYKNLDIYFPEPNQPSLPECSKLVLSNQNSNYFHDKPNVHNKMTVWLLDLSQASAWSKVGEVEIHKEIEVEFKEDGHVYLVVCVDLDSKSCDKNDPDIAACRRDEYIVKYKKSGMAVNIAAN